MRLFTQLTAVAAGNNLQLCVRMHPNHDEATCGFLLRFLNIQKWTISKRAKLYYDNKDSDYLQQLKHKSKQELINWFIEGTCAEGNFKELMSTDFCVEYLTKVIN